MNDLPGLIKQCQRDSQRWFPNISDDLPFAVLALVGESGELANLAKKVVRGSLSMEAARADMAEEAVDVLIYLCMIFGILDVDVAKIYREKRAKNELRFGKGPLTDLNPSGAVTGVVHEDKFLVEPGIPGHVPFDEPAPNRAHYCLSTNCDHRQPDPGEYYRSRGA